MVRFHPACIHISHYLGAAQKSHDQNSGQITAFTVRKPKKQTKRIWLYSYLVSYSSHTANRYWSNIRARYISNHVAMKSLLNNSKYTLYIYLFILFYFFKKWKLKCLGIVGFCFQRENVRIFYPGDRKLRYHFHGTIKPLALAIWWFSPQIISIQVSHFRRQQISWSWLNNTLNLSS